MTLDGGAVQYVFRKSDGTSQTVTATITDSSAGETQYVTQSGDLDQPGSLEIQADIVLPNWVGRSSILETFVVEKL